MAEERDPTANTSFWQFLLAVKHHWLAIVGGGLIMVAVLPLFERLTGKNVPTWVYIAVLVAFGLWACYLAWRDSRLELKKSQEVHPLSRKNEALADRLKTLLREAGEVAYGSARLGTHEGMDKMARHAGYVSRVNRFLEVNYTPEIVERYKKGGTRVLEELLAECYGDEQSPVQNQVSNRPLIRGFLREVSPNYFIEQSRDSGNFTGKLLGSSYAILVHLVNESPISTTVHNFSLIVETQGKKLVADAEEEWVDPEGAWRPSWQIEHEKNLLNLVSIIGANTPLVQGIGVDGYLVFHYPGFGIDSEKNEPERLPEGGTTISFTPCH